MLAIHGHGIFPYSLKSSESNFVLLQGSSFSYVYMAYAHSKHRVDSNSSLGAASAIEITVVYYSYWISGMVLI